MDLPKGHISTPKGEHRPALHADTTQEQYVAFKTMCRERNVNMSDMLRWIAAQAIEAHESEGGE